MFLAPGTRLGPYEVTAKIGEGGRGEVYRATDTKLNRDVALKVLPPCRFANQATSTRYTEAPSDVSTANEEIRSSSHGDEVTCAC